MHPQRQALQTADGHSSLRCQLDVNHQQPLITNNHQPSSQLSTIVTTTVNPTTIDVNCQGAIVPTLKVLRNVPCVHRWRDHRLRMSRHHVQVSGHHRHHVNAGSHLRFHGVSLHLRPHKVGSEPRFNGVGSHQSPILIRLILQSATLQRQLSSGVPKLICFA